MLSFAGVPLIVPTADICNWVARHVSTADVYEFARRTWPGARLTGTTFPLNLPPRPIKVGSLYWPVGASRWAVGHYCCTRDQLGEIRDQCYGSEADSFPHETTPRALKIEKAASEGAGPNESVIAYMYMLPPRPLGGWTADADLNSLWLLTLVDERYYWQFRSGGELDVTAATTWEALYGLLADRLEIDIEVDEIAEAYLQPDPESFTTRYESLPVLLDAVAWNCGQRIVRDLTTGAVRAMGWEASNTRHVENLERRLTHLAGGRFALATADAEGETLTVARDLTAILPAEVLVTFPVAVNGEPTNETWTVSVPLTDFPEFGDDIAGHAGEKTFHDTALACDDCAEASGSGSDPCNGDELRELAEQIANDFYKYAAYTDADLVMIGAIDWRSEGLHDSIEWEYRLDTGVGALSADSGQPRPGKVTTRVQRPAWNLGVEELLHQTAECGEGTGSGGDDDQNFVDLVVGVCPIFGNQSGDDTITPEPGECPDCDDGVPSVFNFNSVSGVVGDSSCVEPWNNFFSSPKPLNKIGECQWASYRDTAYPFCVLHLFHNGTRWILRWACDNGCVCEWYANTLNCCGETTFNKLAGDTLCEDLPATLTIIGSGGTCGGGGDETGSGVSRVVIGIKVEKQRFLVPPGFVAVGEPFCEVNEDDCCEEPGESCSSCPDAQPANYTATMGTGATDGTCTDCAALDGYVWELPQALSPLSPCLYYQAVGLDLGCSGIPNIGAIFIIESPSRQSFYLAPDGAINSTMMATYGRNGSWDCFSPITLTLESGDPSCNWPSTVTIEAA